MAEKIVMPKLGATMEEGTIDSWLVDIGEEVEEGDPILEIQTDKITMEIEAETDGVLLKKLYEQGDTVPVQNVIAYIGAAEEEIIESDENNVEENNSVEDVPTKEKGSIKSAVTSGDNSLLNEDYIRRTPIARRLASENNIPLSEIKGTGPLGRIQKIDVLNYLKENQQRITPLAKKIADKEALDISNITGSGAHEKIVKEDVMEANQLPPKDSSQKIKGIPFKGMRKVIAKRISDSFYTAPHVTLHSEIDMTSCVELRKQLLPVIEETEGVRVSYNDIILKATAFALKRNPSLNVSLEKEKEIVYHSNIHVGFAVAVSEGLVVPVLQHVNQKGLAAIAKEAKTMAKKARESDLSPDDMQGSTFTISNLGMFAVDGFTPIINQPNAAILGVGRIVKKPVVVGEDIKVQSMMTLSLSFDHRIVDGAPAAQFLTDLKDGLEQPYKLMV